MVSGLLAGNTIVEGSFQSCYEIEKDLNVDDDIPFGGRFCTLRLLQSQGEDIGEKSLPSVAPSSLALVS